MILGDYHVHTLFCDGKDTPREIVETAYKAGLPAIGITGHGETPFDRSYCMTEQKTEQYVKEIAKLKTEYDGKIDLLCGIECDIFSTVPNYDFDYVIGSSHYVKVGNNYCETDNSIEQTKDCIERYFNGDALAYCESYFEELSKAKGYDIIGHFDLITKFNERERIIDTKNPRYIQSATDALDKLLKTEAVFEVNTGAISRGYRTVPYPEYFLLKYIRDKGGRVILTGDTHSKDKLCYAFDSALRLVQEAGFKSIVQINKNGFYEIKI